VKILEENIIQIMFGSIWSEVLSYKNVFVIVKQWSVVDMGFCSDFRGREHRLSDTIVNKFYPDVPTPNRVVTPPPKAKVNTDEAVEILNTYINKCIQPTKVVSVTKIRNKYVVNVTDTECDAKHGGDCHFVVEKSGIEMKCSKCIGNPRKYILNKKSKEILFPDTK